MDKNKLVMDLETKKSFSEVGGQQNRRELGISMAGVFDYQTNELKAYREEELGELEERLRENPEVIGFNIKNFDFPVLQPYLKKIKLSSIPYLDLLEEVTKALGHRLKLESLLRATLGEGKSGQGLDAIYYFREGDWTSLEKYCLDDVRLTRDLYEYGQKHGQLYFLNYGNLKSVPISWADDQRIRDLLKDAFHSHQRIEIEYLNFSDNPTKDDLVKTTQKIDIQDIADDRVKAYSHLEKEDKIFEIRKIIEVKKMGETAIHQESLI